MLIPKVEFDSLTDIANCKLTEYTFLLFLLAVNFLQDFDWFAFSELPEAGWRRGAGLALACVCSALGPSRSGGTRHPAAHEEIAKTILQRGQPKDCFGERLAEENVQVKTAGLKLV